MERKQRCLATVGAIMLTLLVGCTSADPYARNPNERDPRAHPLAKRSGPAATPAEVQAEFKALRRPIIVRYVRYSGQTVSEARAGENSDYTHIVLTDEACAFVNRHTFDELALGLSAVLPDPYWNGDAVAMICVASNHHFHFGSELAASGYRSPDDRGRWPGRVRKHLGSMPLFMTCVGATVAIDVYDGTVVARTREDMDQERRDYEVMRRHG